MAGTIRTVAEAVLMALMPAAGGIALLGTVGSGLTLMFSPASRNSGVATAFIVSVVVFIGVLALLTHMRRRAQRLVAAINAESGLRLDSLSAAWPNRLFSEWRTNYAFHGRTDFGLEHTILKAKAVRIGRLRWKFLLQRRRIGGAGAFPV